MNYQSFQSLIVEQLEDQIPDPKKIRIESLHRINGLQSDALIIMQNEVNVAPTIYLRPYYEEYSSGKNFSDIFREILDIYEKNRPAVSINSSFFTDFSNIENRIVYKLINYQLNEALLADVPHERFLDLAVVFYFLVFSEPAGNAAILIHNKHLEYWNVTSDHIHALAKENTPRLLPYELRRMSDLLPKEARISSREELPMYVLTTKNNLNGACCMLYPNLIRDFARRMDSDFYLLPSSIHEVILLPAQDCSSIEQLSAMVSHINEIEVAKEEVLSGHAYYYSRKDDCISM